MYPKWDKKRSIVAAAVVSVCIAGIFFVYLSERESDVAQGPPSHGQTDSGVPTNQEKKPVFTKIDDPVTEILDSPEAAKERYGKKLVAQVLKKEEEGVTGYPFSSIIRRTFRTTMTMAHQRTPPSFSCGFGVLLMVRCALVLLLTVRSCLWK